LLLDIVRAIGLWDVDVYCCAGLDGVELDLLDFLL